jgi:hypothetical protein
MAEKKKNYYTMRTQASKYTSVPIELLTADIAIIKSTGEEVKITDTLIRVYLYMRNNYCVSLDNKNSDGYYESWDSIAANVGKSKDLFKKGEYRPNILLTKLGLLELTKLGKGRSDMKIVKDIVEILDSVTFLNTKAADYKGCKLKEREDYIKTKVSKVEVIAKLPTQTIIIPDPTSPWDFGCEEYDEEWVPF